MDTAKYKVRLQIISPKSQVTLQGSNQEIVINKQLNPAKNSKCYLIYFEYLFKLMQLGDVGLGGAQHKQT